MSFSIVFVGLAASSEGWALQPREAECVGAGATGQASTFGGKTLLGSLIAKLPVSACAKLDGGFGSPGAGRLFNGAPGKLCEGDHLELADRGQAAMPGTQVDRLLGH